MSAIALSALVSLAMSTPFHWEKRIVGGAPVSADDYPWMAFLAVEPALAENPGYCGACLIAIVPPILLTAAHCVQHNVSRQRYAYINRTYHDADSDSFYVLNWTESQVTYHPDYDPRSALNDIALIVIDDGDLASFSTANLPRIPTEKLFENETCCEDGENLTVIGTGTLWSGGARPSSVHGVSVNYINYEDCTGSSTAYSTSDIDYKMICAGAPGKDSCQGDNGGPLFRTIFDQNVLQEVPEIVGLASWGFGCAQSNAPGVYTSIAHYYDWIVNVSGIDFEALYNSFTPSPSSAPTPPSVAPSAAPTTSPQMSESTKAEVNSVCCMIITLMLMINVAV